MINTKYDIIIIGAGIGGLICGIELAHSGLKVAILEQHYQPGGYCSSFKRKDFTFDAAAIHALAGVGNTDIYIGKYLAKLDLDIEFIKLDPWENVFFGNNNIKYPSDSKKFIEYLKKSFPAEKNIDLFFNEIKTIMKYFPIRNLNPFMEKYYKLTYQEMLDIFFIDEKIKAILSPVCLYIGLPPKKAAAVSIAVLFGSFVFNNAYYPKGGTGAFSNSLAKKFQSLGGELLLSHEVNKIIINKFKAKGICFLNKKNNQKGVMNAEYIISNGDVINTFNNLVGRNNIEAEYINNINNREINISVFMVCLGVNINKNELIGKNGFYFKSYNINKDDNAFFFISIPSLVDNNLAPKNNSTIQIIVKNIDKKFNDFSSQKIKMELQEEIINGVDNFIPDLSTRIVIKESATPKTFQRYTSNSKGSIAGWAVIPEQVWIDNLTNRTPIDNLFLVGHWSFPGGSIAGVITSGLLVAREIKKKF